jgi:hypothetical protein
MALVKHNNNSISSITTPGQIAQGKMTLISSQTASGSASISFTSGIDSTYPIYKFELIELHPASRTQLTFNFSSDSGSNYNVTKTTTLFYAIHTEDNITAGLSYDNTKDLAQGTGFQILTRSDIDEIMTLVVLEKFFYLIHQSQLLLNTSFQECNKWLITMLVQIHMLLDMEILPQLLMGFNLRWQVVI